MLASLRRISDNILLCNNIKAYSGGEWRYTKPNQRTTTGVTQTQRVTSQERWWTMTLEFASDDPVNTIARYDRMAYEANNDFHFLYVHIDGEARECKIMQYPVVRRLDFPTADVIEVECVMKQVGHIPVLPYAPVGAG